MRHVEGNRKITDGVLLLQSRLDMDIGDVHGGFGLCCAHFDANFFCYCVSLKDSGIAYETKQPFLEQFHKYVDFAHARENSLLQDLNRDPEPAMSK